MYTRPTPVMRPDRAVPKPALVFCRTWDRYSLRNSSSDMLRTLDIVVVMEWVGSRVSMRPKIFESDLNQVVYCSGLQSADECLPSLWIYLGTFQFIVSVVLLHPLELSIWELGSDQYPPICKPPGIAMKGSSFSTAGGM
jgi:hypothetical protein